MKGGEKHVSLACWVIGAKPNFHAGVRYVERNYHEVNGRGKLEKKRCC